MVATSSELGIGLSEGIFTFTLVSLQVAGSGAGRLGGLGVIWGSGRVTIQIIAPIQSNEAIAKNGTIWTNFTPIAV